MHIEYCPHCGTRLGEQSFLSDDFIRCKLCKNELRLTAKLAVCAVLSNHDAILMLKRAFPPREHTWCLPGGFVKPGESPRQAIRREVLEETGIVIKDGRFAGISTDHEYGVVVIGYSYDLTSREYKRGAEADALLWVAIAKSLQLELSFGSTTEILTEFIKRHDRSYNM